ncbi:hypothetical protein P7K49_029564 [Saguinus oedipus]|uniref:Uncharacterized protein n=1 Tax=Saguinus oedipus TaxID=9490 RepID=A0ABQ9U7J3_SAGOE|nr:hypothetical protein P7K49_029564 [Saguinus oedipus]
MEWGWKVAQKQGSEPGAADLWGHCSPGLAYFSLLPYLENESSPVSPQTWPNTPPIGSSSLVSFHVENGGDTQFKENSKAFVLTNVKDDYSGQRTSKAPFQLLESMSRREALQPLVREEGEMPCLNLDLGKIRVTPGLPHVNFNQLCDIHGIAPQLSQGLCFKQACHQQRYLLLEDVVNNCLDSANDS